MKQILISLIKIYKKAISPLFPPSCRFYPTCSEYSMESIRKFGAFYGTILSVKRIIRCNPFNKGGVDPVPEKINKINLKKFFSK